MKYKDSFWTARELEIFMDGEKISITTSREIRIEDCLVKTKSGLKSGKKIKVGTGKDMDIFLAERYTMKDRVRPNWAQ